MKKLITKEEFINNLSFSHIRRPKPNPIEPHSKVNFYNFDTLETFISYKNVRVITVLTEIHRESIRIDVDTNRKFIKKHKLPFKKSKVVDGLDRRTTEVQLDLGVRTVRKVLRLILKELKKEFKFIPIRIVTSRCNGIFMNSSNSKHQSCRTCRIPLRT